MRSGLLVSLAGLVLAAACGTSSAEPTGDLPGWTQRFTQATLKSDAGLITSAIKEVADPRLNVDGIRSVVQSAIGLVKGQTPEYSEQFGEKSVGSFAKRINVAVRYSKNFLFYSVVLLRDDKGWQAVQFNIDGNLNKILDAPWPS